MKRGVLYIAFGEEYQKEATDSIVSLRHFHPQLPCCVISDSPLRLLPNDVEVILRDREVGEYPLRAKPKYIRESPFDCTLFLDTDTTVVRPIEDVFLLLERFDIGVYVQPRYLRSPKFGYIAWANSGVVLFRHCEAVSKTFDRWLDLFDKQISEVRELGTKRPLTDDAWLMPAICESPVRMVPLPAAMNFTLQIPTTTASPIHIVHGRHRDPANLARRMDAKRPDHWETRVWIPRLKGRLPDGNLRSPNMWLKAPFYTMHAVMSRIWTRTFGR